MSLFALYNDKVTKKKFISSTKQSDRTAKLLEKNKQELSEQLKDITNQLRAQEEQKKELEDQVYFLKDEVRELNDEIKSCMDKAARLNNEVSLTKNRYLNSSELRKSALLFKGLLYKKVKEHE